VLARSRGPGISKRTHAVAISHPIIDEVEVAVPPEIRSALVLHDLVRVCIAT